MTLRCPGVNKDGSACRARPLPGREHCPWHDPERQSGFAESRRRGGAGKSREARARKLLKLGLGGIGDIEQRLMVAFDEVLEGTLDPRVGNCAANIARTLKDLAVASEFEPQLAELRDELARLTGRQSA